MSQCIQKYLLRNCVCGCIAHDQQRRYRTHQWSRRALSVGWIRVCVTWCLLGETLYHWCSLSLSHPVINFPPPSPFFSGCYGRLSGTGKNYEHGWTLATLGPKLDSDPARPPTPALRLLWFSRFGLSRMERKDGTSWDQIERFYGGNGIVR